MRDTNSENVAIADNIPKLTLRVLCGPNHGAQTTLDGGVWLVGASDTSDLTFADPELAETHLRIAVEAGRIDVTALAPGVRIGAKDLPEGSRMVLAPLTLVQVGGTIFSIGPTGSSFPEIKFVAVSRKPDTSMHASADPELASAWSGGIPLQFRLGALACALLIPSILGVWAAIGRDPPAPAGDLMRIARNIIRESNVAGKAKIVPVDGRLHIEGDLRPRDNAKPKAAPSSARLQAEVLSTRTTAPSEPRLVDLVTTVIRGFGIEGSVQVTNAGEVTIKGYGPSNAKVETAIHSLRQDIPKLSKVEDAIVTPERARVFLEAVMTSELRPSVHILTKAGGLFVSGTLTPIAFEAWQNVASRFQERFAPQIRLETQFRPVILPELRGIHLGRTSFIVFENGKRLKVGDSLESLGRIIAIDRGGVSVLIGADKVHVPYPSKPSWIAEEEKG
ncbi:type III secretion system YscD/HrpQ family protein (plasmid) [Rhizobium etli bv. phaseoli str. IE4803]|nr:type III secretion system YscD/HrpQ family protein [Rhizobium etli bv. phaseoli str. IE4803]